MPVAAEGVGEVVGLGRDVLLCRCHADVQVLVGAGSQEAPHLGRLGRLLRRVCQRRCVVYRFHHPGARVGVAEDERREQGGVQLLVIDVDPAFAWCPEAVGAEDLAVVVSWCRRCPNRRRSKQQTRRRCGGGNPAPGTAVPGEAGGSGRCS